MKRCISALAATLLLALAGGVANAYADSGPGGQVGQTLSQPSQSATQSASNTSGDTSQSFENGGGEITNVGLNNNTVQAGGEPSRPPVLGPESTESSGGASNQSNNNTNTAGNTTAVIGNNDQQTNTQGLSQNQTQNQQGSGGSCCKKNDVDQNQRSSQTASNRDGDTRQKFENGGGEITNVGLNNNTVQKGESAKALPTYTDGGGSNGGNESNGNTNTAGDTTAVIGNNHQQTNTQGSSQSQSSGGGSCGCGSPKSGGPPDQQQPAGQWASNNSGSQPKHESCGCDKPRYEPCGCEKKKTEGGQSFENGGGVITNIGLNNNTVQVGSGNESNNNTNTAGGTTAVIGNNDQQSNTQGSSQNQSSGGSCCHKPDGKDGYGRSNSCGCGSPKHESSPDQRQSAGQWASNSSGDTRQKFENGGGEIINVGANNNTVQLGDHNQSNGNTNTAGDTTAVIGNNHQQTNTQGSSQSQSSGGGSCGCGSPKYGDSPKHDGSSDQRQSAGQWASNSSGRQPKEDSWGCDKPKYERCGCEKKTEDGQKFKNGGGVITNIGLNNNTVQVGRDNESNNNTNTAGGTTAVIGNNDQQSNTQGSSQNQSSGGSCCHKPDGMDGKDGYGRSNSCGCGSPKHESSPDQRQSAGQWASNSSGDTRQKFEKGGGEIINVGANNNTVQIGDHNESNGNTNTAGDTTAVIGNNHQQTNTQGSSQSQSSGGGSCGCGSPKYGGSPDQQQSAGQWASNNSGSQPKHESCGCDKPRYEPCGCEKKKTEGGQSFENGGGVITNIGLNNNTVQVGSGNESNNNTNTAGGTTAVIGNNDQQSNTQGSSQNQSSGGSCCHQPDGKDGYGRSNSCGCGSPKHESSPDQWQSAGQWASNDSGSQPKHE